ncbi:MAG TPA: cytochrome c3 family protein [Verrucomicrobiae bacterium]|nr:cytochrome c3 family protein [Verrucomicrobiae bacterium]
MQNKPKLLCLAILIAAGVHTQNVWAGYAWDGAVQNGTTGEWIVPNDMVCVVGLHVDGTLDIAPGITNSRECIYYNSGLKTMDPVDVTSTHLPTVKSALTSYGTCKDSGSGGNSSYVWDFVNNRCLDVSPCSGTDAATKGTLTWNAGSSTCSLSAACTVANYSGTAGTNDGAKHALTTSICVDGSGNGIPLTDLDRTFAMCTSKGGIWKQTSDTLVVSGSGATATATVQVPATPGFGGACVAYTRQFKGQDDTGTPLAFGAKGTSSSDAGFCYASMNMTSAFTTPATQCPASDSNGHPNAGFNSSTAYDWSYSSSKCTYAKGIKGYPSSALTKANGTTVSTSTNVDLSVYTTMGDCLAIGGSWNNWVGQPNSTTAVATTVGSVIPAWDFSRQAPETTNGCLHCHSTLTQYNGPAERQKDTFVKTGHKNVLRKVTPGKVWAGPNAGGDLEIYTEAASGLLDFTGAQAFVNGVWQNLLYIFGDWMSPAPEGLKTIVDIGGVAKSADSGGVTSSELCASCHTTGWSNPSAGLCSLSSQTTSGDCTSAGGTWYPLIGVQGIGTPGFASAQPSASFPAVDFTAGGQWDRDGVQCPRCHNVTAPKVVDSQIAASQFTSTHVTSGGMGALADGVGRTNLCFGCHQSIAKTLNGTGPDADLSHPENLQVKNTGTGNPADAPWTAYVPDFDGRGPGNMFLNSPHARFSGNVVPNSLGKYDLEDATGNNNGNASKYNSAFQGYTCWQSATSTSPAKTMIVGGVIKEIKTQTDCEALYGAGAWRSDLQGTCVTCHDVHNSLFVESTREAALRKVCTDCHTNSIQRLWHPTGKGTPLDVSEPWEACVTCHMPRATPSGLRMHIFRIDPSNGYSTFPTAAEFGVGAAPTKMIANSSPDGSYTSAVWVDVDYACGQCHGGSRGPDATKNGAPYFTKSGLAHYAETMHSPGPIVNVTGDVSGYTVTLKDTSVDDSIVFPSNPVTIQWGDKTPSTIGSVGGTFTHTYVRPKKYVIVYLVLDKHGVTTTKKITVTIRKGHASTLTLVKN